MQAVALINFAGSQACASSAIGDAEVELEAKAKKAHLSLKLLSHTRLLSQIRRAGWSCVRSNMIRMWEELSCGTELKLGGDEAKGRGMKKDQHNPTQKIIDNYWINDNEHQMYGLFLTF